MAEIPVEEQTPNDIRPHRDYEREHRELWDHHADDTVEAMQDYTLAVFQFYMPIITIERLGVIERRGPQGTSGTARLTDAPGGVVQSVDLQIGQPPLKLSDVGKRCRVWERIHYEIRTEPHRRVPVVTNRIFLLDTVFGPGPGA